MHLGEIVSRDDRVTALGEANDTDCRINGVVRCPATGTELAKLEASRGEWSRWRGPNGDGIYRKKDC